MKSLLPLFRHHESQRGGSFFWLFLQLSIVFLLSSLSLGQDVVVDGQQQRLLVDGGASTSSATTTTSSTWDPPPYTSPPLKEAMEATPIHYRDDHVIQLARQTDSNHQCGLGGGNLCHIPFHPTTTNTNGRSSSKIGVVLYPGALIDPRSYSPLAKLVRDRYGLPVVIPIFAKDLPFLATSPTLVHNPQNYKCYSGRLEMAQMEFPYVESWILVGHSMGGVTAQSDMWQQLQHQTRRTTGGGEEEEAHPKPYAGGLVLLSSYVIPDLPNTTTKGYRINCEGADFSNTNLPMAQLIGSKDQILDRQKLQNNAKYLPQNATFFMEILGGNHGSFGAYDASGRDLALKDPKQSETLPEQKAIIPRSIVWSLTADAIGHVASRMNMNWNLNTELSSSSSSSTTTTTTSPSSSSTTLSLTLNKKKNNNNKPEEGDHKEENHHYYEEGEVEVEGPSSSQRGLVENRLTTLSWMFQWLVALKR